MVNAWLAFMSGGTFHQKDGTRYGLTAGIYVTTIRQLHGDNRPIFGTSCLKQRVPPGYMTRHTVKDMHTTNPDNISHAQNSLESQPPAHGRTM
ncbi:protein of unknown function [Nitrospira defluvii]|uniref:Uncharacterized protein n=1 Tax=Nitrospira defluvii TaxID=330214 RepID=D8PH67_9BACT|nr:protein of unknown function [Nitrospira defluvii]